MPRTSNMPDAGLFARGGDPTPVPLKGVAIEGEISGLCARVAVAHRYVNTEKTPLECVYVFPLDEGAALCGFEAVVDGTLVVGEVQEREKAFETYDDAIERGHGAFLLDEERPDVFQASIGNVAPGKEVLVRLTYVTELTVDSGRLRFTIPTTVSPRYAPDDDHTGVGRSDAEALNPPMAWSVPYGLALSVRVSMPGRITAVESPSHPISLTLSDQHTMVTLRDGTALDRDFVLSIDACGLDQPQAWTERTDDGAQNVAVAFVPTFPELSSPAEIIFVVDRSGSMAGSSIAEVRNALQLSLRSLFSGCRFNIIGFGSTCTSLFRESRVYDQASLDAASRHVAELQADLGGTEILPALERALERPAGATLPRQVIVLTDGEVTNTDAVLALAANRPPDTRIFTFGIGAGASHHLVRGLARAGGGSAEFIYPGERIEPKVVRQCGRLLSPALTGATVEWLGGDVTQAPAHIPPVFAGSRLVVYGLVKNGRPATVRLSATGSSGPVAFEVPVCAPAETTGRTVATLAARARIRELEEATEWLGTRGSRQRARKRNSSSREIIELSMRYGIISRETSFVAVERRDAPLHGDMQLRRVPVALTSGWGALRDTATLSVAMGAAPAASSGVFGSIASIFGGGVDSRDTLLGAADFDDSLNPSMLQASATERRVGGDTPGLVHAPPGPVDALVALQAADGYWTLSPPLADIIGRRLEDIEAAIAGTPGEMEHARRAWATALALAWLQLNASDRRDEWQFLARKARKWLDGVAAAPPRGETTWMKAAERLLAP